MLPKIKISFTILILCLTYTSVSSSNDMTIDDDAGENRYKIDGRVVRPDSSLVPSHEWFGNTKVYTNTGHFGFLREDGSFSINNLPWGSHVVQVMSPMYVFEFARVDISSKGKIRARILNNIQPSKVDLIPYPLRLKSLGRIQYFQQREQWRMTDLLFNPMVLMTVLPLAFMMILPRLSDADTKKEMEQMQSSMPKMETPDLSQYISDMFTGGSNTQPCPPKATNRAKTGKRREK